MAFALLTLALGCRPDTDLFLVVVDGGNVRVPVRVAGFSGFALAGEDARVVSPEPVVPRFVPIGLPVPGGEWDGLTATFEGEALRLRGATTGGTPFAMRVAMETLPYGAADLDEPVQTLVLDLSLLIDGAALDALSVASDPDPDDGEPFPLALGPDSPESLAFAAAAPAALWLGTPAEAEARYAGRWPWHRGRFVDEEASGCGSSGTASGTATGFVAPDTAIPDTGSVPADTAVPDTGGASSGGGCGAASDSGAASGSGDSSDSADAGDADGCACDCGGGGLDSGDSAAAGALFAFTLRRRRRAA